MLFREKYITKMEKGNDETYYCSCCLSKPNGSILRKYITQNEALRRHVLKNDILLCYICWAIAKRFDLFMNNVQKNQISLKKRIKQPIISLSVNTLQSLVIYSGNEIRNNQEPIDTLPPVEIYPENETKDIEEPAIKIEKIDEDFHFDVDEFETADIKLEDEDDVVTLKDEKLPNELPDTKTQEKEEKLETKIIIENNGSNLKSRSINLGVMYTTIKLTKKDLAKERQKQLNELTKSPFHCGYCMLSFAYKMTLENHMMLHDKSAGEFKCDICKQHFKRKLTLMQHSEKHFLRFKCKACGIIRKDKNTIKNHYLLRHSESSVFVCPENGCYKTFNLPINLQKHTSTVHRNERSTVCTYCNKTYKNIHAHIDAVHSDELSTQVKVELPYSCEECGKSFKKAGVLKNHLVTHSNKMDFYCVECDKRFKTDWRLKAHLLTSIHVSPKDCLYACNHCDKRFIRKCLLDRHMRRVLDIKPHKCDKCEKAYITNGKLLEHKRTVHEGYERPRKYKCDLCEKAFKSSAVLKNHTRTHTGERPFKCKECSASFNQSSILQTHVNLVHLKLKRRGNKKKSIKKSSPVRTC